LNFNFHFLFASSSFLRYKKIKALEHPLLAPGQREVKEEGCKKKTSNLKLLLKGLNFILNGYVLNANAIIVILFLQLLPERSFNAVVGLQLVLRVTTFPVLTESLINFAGV